MSKNGYIGYMLMHMWNKRSRFPTNFGVTVVSTTFRLKLNKNKTTSVYRHKPNFMRDSSMCL